ncbi:UNVERIFIED_CONTAM: hypothetical protein Sindi_1310300 [Sesamum indicum]
MAMQIEGTYETKEKTMVLYHKKAKTLMAQFERCSIHQVPRCENDRADSLPKFGAILSGIKDHKITVMIKHQIVEEIDLSTIEEPCSWKDEIVGYFKEGFQLSDPLQARRLKFKPARFTLIGTQLYKRTIDEPLLKCLDHERAKGKIFSSKDYQAGLLLAYHGIDILGPFPPARAQKKFIIVAVEYFSKWVKAEAVAKIAEGELINYIWNNIICRFVIPRIIVSDNGTQFQGKRITAWCKELKIQQNFTAVDHSQVNGQTKVTNRTILQHSKFQGLVV